MAVALKQISVPIKLVVAAAMKDANLDGFAAMMDLVDVVKVDKCVVRKTIASWALPAVATAALPILNSSLCVGLTKRLVLTIDLDDRFRVFASPLYFQLERGSGTPATLNVRL